MDAGTVLIGLVVVLVIGAIVLLNAPIPSHPIEFGVTREGKYLHHKFRMLGTLKGKTKAEIIEAVGQPSSISVAGEGRLLLQWQATGCHMALLFEGDVCLGITHEYLANS